MLGHRKFDFQDYLGIFRRRYRAVIAPVLICPVLAYAAALILVPRYVSTSLIFIDRPQVGADVVKPFSAGDLIERINAIEQQVFSRTRLEPLLTKYGILENNTPVSDEAVDRLRKAVAIAPAELTNGLAGGGRTPIPGLSITCTAGSAWMAHEECTDITSMFIEASLEQVQQIEKGTTDFLTAQLADAKRKLDEEDAKLAAFKRQNLGRLPDDQEMNLRVLLDHNSELEAAADALDRATQDRSYAQSLLQQQLGSLRPSVAPTESGPDELQARLVKLQQDLSAMEAQFTSSYPDVATLKSQISDLKKQIAERPAPGSKAGDTADPKPQAEPEPPQIQQLRAQIRQDDEIIRTRTEEQTRLKTQIAGYEQKLQLSPVVESEVKNLTRDHETALHFYNDLLQKESGSEMATSLERREQGERFRLLDSPTLPVKPDFPKRSVFLAAGLAGGIAIGFALVMLLESLDKSIQDERDIEVLLKTLNLATLPSVKSLKGWKSDSPTGGTPKKPTLATILSTKE